MMLVHLVWAVSQAKSKDGMLRVMLETQYFEARRAHHENRFEAQATLGVAGWARGRMVGLRQAHAAEPAVVVTKLIDVVVGSRLLVDADGPGVTVEVLTPSGLALRGFEAAHSLPLAGADAGDGLGEVQWGGAGHGPRGVGEAAATLTTVRLRFVLTHGARLYSFQLRR